MGTKQLTVAHKNYNSIVAIIALCSKSEMRAKETAKVLNTTKFKHPSNRGFNANDVYNITSNRWTKQKMTPERVWKSLGTRHRRFALRTLKPFRSTDTSTVVKGIKETALVAKTPDSVKARSVEFLGDDILSVKFEDVIYTPVRRICAVFGVDTDGQLERIGRHSILKSSTCELRVDDLKGVQRHQICLEVKMIPLWVAMFRPSQIKESSRAKIESYIRDCADILAKVWMGDGFAFNPNPARVAIEKARVELDNMSESNAKADHIIKKIQIQKELLSMPAEDRSDFERDNSVLLQDLGICHESSKRIEPIQMFNDDIFLPPHKMGNACGGVSSFVFNRTVTIMGWQAKVDGQIVITDAGRPYGRQSGKGQQVEWHLGRSRAMVMAFRSGRTLTQEELNNSDEAATPSQCQFSM